jgi:uncharacterized protein DUF4382
MQIDLLAPAGDACSAPAFAAASIPAGVYRQMRLRVLTEESNHAATLSALPEENLCGNAGWNCIVLSDGTKRKLLVGDAFPGSEKSKSVALQIPSERIATGSFVVLPDGAQDFAVEFDPATSEIFFSRDAMRLIPKFRVAPRETCSGLPAAASPL